MGHFATIDRAQNGNAVLRVIGVGGGGGNAINYMVERGLDGVDYISVNTDRQALDKSLATSTIQIGNKITKGLGAGASPEIGRKAAEEDKERLAEALQGSDMVFVTTGMGGGTGTGAAPVVAQVAKSLDILVVGIATKPFSWEGKKRMLNAEAGIKELRDYVDSLIVIPNDRLKTVVDGNISFRQAFQKPNEVLYEATRGIADIINVSGFINVDFADVRTVMSKSGVALMGVGVSAGENRAVEAAEKAISSSLLEGLSIKGAQSILLNITGSSNLNMREVEEGNKVIIDAAGEEANVIFGIVEKEEMEDYVSYTVIATGFDAEGKRVPDSDLSSGEKTAPTGAKTDSKFWNSWLGYYEKTDEDVREDELDVPTIFRKMKAQQQSERAEERRDGGERDEERKENYGDRRDDDEEEQGTSFLRMIMD
ncbi:MAG: cell division protein FtsZ [Ignavibacteriales bacterium]|nr:cell division protein FtsZ [Ignavibacteriales bacterium]